MIIVPHNWIFVTGRRVTPDFWARRYRAKAAACRALVETYLAQGLVEAAELAALDAGSHDFMAWEIEAGGADSAQFIAWAPDLTA